MNDRATAHGELFDVEDVQLPREVLGLEGPTYQVWRAMVELRDEHDLCWVTFVNLAKVASVTEAQVRHAVERHLVPNGLVVLHGRGFSPAGSHRYSRRVVGHDAGDGFVRVPPSVYERAIANFEAGALPLERPSADATAQLCQAELAAGILSAESAFAGDGTLEIPGDSGRVCEDDTFTDAAGPGVPVIGGASEATEHAGRWCEAASATHPLTMAANGCHLGHASVAEAEDQERTPKHGKPRAPIAPGADPKVQCVAALQVDGATSFITKADEAKWHPDVQDELLAACRGGVVRLFDASGRGVTLRVDSAGPRNLKLRVAERATIKVDRRAETVEVIAAKEELWTGGGIGPWAETWLRLASLWFLGQQCAGLVDAGSVGWRVHRLELASDFTGLPFRLLDEANLRSRQKGSAWRSSLVKDGERETVEIGGRGRGTIAISIHDKHAQIRKMHRVAPTASIYAQVWRSNRWNGRSRVRRVELRADGKALQLRHEQRGAVVDLSDPAALLDRTKLAVFWHEGTHRHVLTLPAEGVGKGKKPAPDPRWIAVQGVAGLAQAGRYVYAVPTSRVSTDGRRAKLAMDSFVRGAAWLCATGDLPPGDRDHLRRMVGILGREKAFVDKVDAALTSLGIAADEIDDQPAPLPWIGD